MLEVEMEVEISVAFIAQIWWLTILVVIWNDKGAVILYVSSLLERAELYLGMRTDVA